jgi:hypothetical protein
MRGKGILACRERQKCIQVLIGILKTRKKLRRLGSTRDSDIAIKLRKMGVAMGSLSD